MPCAASGSFQDDHFALVVSLSVFVVFSVLGAVIAGQSEKDFGDGCEWDWDIHEVVCEDTVPPTNTPTPVPPTDTPTDTPEPEPTATDTPEPPVVEPTDTPTPETPTYRDADAASQGLGQRVRYHDPELADRPAYALSGARRGSTSAGTLPIRTCCGEARGAAGPAGDGAHYRPRRP